MLQKNWYIPAAAALVLALILGICFGSAKKDLTQLEQQVQAAQMQYEAEIGQLNATVEEQNATISSQQDQIEVLQEKADIHDEMVEIISTHNMGMATYNFQATTDFMVVRKSNANAKITLTAYWTEPGIVYMDYSSDCVELEYDKENWVKTVPLNVIPKEPGFCLVTFSNSRDSNTFSILFLVTE